MFVITGIADNRSLGFLRTVKFPSAWAIEDEVSRARNAIGTQDCGECYLTISFYIEAPYNKAKAMF